MQKVTIITAEIIMFKGFLFLIIKFRLPTSIKVLLLISIHESSLVNSEILEKSKQNGSRFGLRATG